MQRTLMSVNSMRVDMLDTHKGDRKISSKNTLSPTPTGNDKKWNQMKEISYKTLMHFHQSNVMYGITLSIVPLQLFGTLWLRQ